MFTGLKHPADRPPRRAGLIVPSLSLRPANSKEDYGIGDYIAALDTIDAEHELGIGVERGLPDTDPGPDDPSYFMGLIAGALNPMHVGMRVDMVPGLTQAGLDSVDPMLLRSLRGDLINFKAVQQLKRSLMWQAYLRFCRDYIDTRDALAEEFHKFCSTWSWLGPYSLFRALVDWERNPKWRTWDEMLRNYESAKQWLGQHQDREEIMNICRFWQYYQWVLYRQVFQVGLYAATKNVLRVGMLSYFTIADPWAYPHLYLQGRWGGAPPEPAFIGSRRTQELGQFWDNAPYDFPAHAKEGFLWWHQRLSALMVGCHGVLFDHGIGLVRGQYAHPYPESEADGFVGLSREKAIAKVLAMTGRPDYARYFPLESDEGEENRRLCVEQGRARLGAIRDAARKAGAQLVLVEDLGKKPEWMGEVMAELGLPGIIVTKYHRKENFGPFKPIEDVPYLSEATSATHDFPPQVEQYEDLVKAASQGDAGAQLELQRYFGFVGWRAEAPASYTPELCHHHLWTHLRGPSGLTTFGIADVLRLRYKTHIVGQNDTWAWRRRIPKPLTGYLGTPEAKDFKQMVVDSGRSAKDE
jgi:4-alpha-glucanotransferase